MRVMRVLALCLLRLKGFVSKGVLYFLVGGAIGIFVTSLVGGVVVGEMDKVVMDLGLKIISFISVVICVSLGAGEIRRDIQERSIYSLLTKPLSRMQIIVGKTLGIFSIGSLLVVLLGLCLWILVIYMGTGTGFSTMKALVLIMGQVLVVSALITFFASFTTPYLSGLLTLSIYVIGTFLGDLQNFGEKFGGPVAKKAFLLLYYLLPNLKVFQIAGRVAHDATVSLSEMGVIIAYGISYSMFLMMTAAWIFQKRDI